MVVVQPPASRVVGLSIALLIAAGPAITLAGAELLIRIERAQLEARTTELRPRLDAAAERRNGRDVLGSALGGLSLGETVEALAIALPSDDRLVSLSRNSGGQIVAQIASQDPDRLRAALRSANHLEALREQDQRRGADAILVRYSGTIR